MNKHLVITAEIAGALAKGHPVVALESTIVAHGMPFPQNLAMARQVETIIREHGAVPATVAIVDGKMRVGLNDEELSNFAETGPSIMKVSTRDMPFVVARKMLGATTVASTMRIAAIAGIAVFATGGIGGVHRGAATSFDVSADMTEFAESNVAVVTAGAKAILDLPLTLEKLETLGVPVIGFSTDEFPSFYSRSSGLKVPMRCDTASEIAALMKAKWDMGLRGGLVIANPIPADDEIPAAEIFEAIGEAIVAAADQGIGGKNLTPFLLARLAKTTGGRSLQANIALAFNNARVAAEIAVAFAKTA
jgi:pseudouridylate synthase